MNVEPVRADSSCTETATIAGGCFWCTEAIFERLKGVCAVVSGYAGGTLANPTYELVSSGITGHAESIQIKFDPAELSYHDLLTVFFHLHDPTTLNRQGADVGTEYRSIVFYHSDPQRKIAEEVKDEIEKAHLWSKPLVTEIVPATAFYPAEEYHQDYFARNARQPYCSGVIAPKIAKLEREFGAKLKAGR